MLKKHPIPSVFNPLIENRKRFPIIEFQPFLQEIYISTIERIVSQFFDIAPFLFLRHLCVGNPCQSAPSWENSCFDQ